MSDAVAQRAVGAAAPAILSGMANLASKPEGAQMLADAIAEQSPRILSFGSAVGGSYINHDVYNNGGEKIGEIKDRIVGPGGRIAAAVIGVGGFLGIGEKAVAVTFSSMRITQRDSDQRLVADATKDGPKEAPTYRETPPGECHQVDLTRRISRFPNKRVDAGQSPSERQP